MTTKVFIICDVDSHDVYTGFITASSWSDDLSLSKRYGTYEKAKAQADAIKDRRVTVVSALSHTVAA
jgi:hypothetical protein